MMNSKPVKLIAFLVVAALMLILPLVLQSTGSNSWVRIVDVALLYVLLALGLNIVVGYAGLLDLGFIAFFAVGAYLYGLLASPHLTDTFAWLAATFPTGLHMNFWLVMVLAGIVAGVTGLILGFPVLKLRGDYLAIVTLGFGEIVRIFMLNLDRPINLTNGPKGLTNVDAVSVFGHRMSQRLEINIGDFSYTFEAVTMYYYLILFFVVVAIVIAYRLQDSRIGRAWMAIREDEIAAKAMGLNTRNLKLAAFGMSATFGGIAGVLFASFMRAASTPSPSSSWSRS
jgi:branched-chain amino acid transport system permease protein